MIEDIKKIIEDNLPTQVSKQLQEYLADYNANKEIITKLREQKAELEELNKELLQKSQFISDYHKKAKKLSEDLQKWEIEKREYKITELECKYNDVRSLMHDVFRNKTLTYETNENFNKNYYNQQGSYCTDNHDNHKTTTVKED